MTVLYLFSLFIFYLFLKFLSFFLSFFPYIFLSFFLYACIFPHFLSQNQVYGDMYSNSLYKVI